VERADQLTSALLIHGAAQDQLVMWPAESVQCCVTSPPYWGLRDYSLPSSIWLTAGLRDWPDLVCPGGHEWGDKMQHRGGAGVQGSTSQRVGRQNIEAQAKVRDAGNFCVRCGAWRGCLGLEPTPELFVEHIVTVFREVRRVLRDDGTLWLNLGDSYAGSGRGGNPDAGTKQGTNTGSQTVGVLYGRDHESAAAERERIKEQFAMQRAAGIKPKDLIGIPWMVAFALRADGWYLRSEIIWHKPNPMPESVIDRPTKAHEQLFLLAKSPRYYYDADAVREPLRPKTFTTFGAGVKSKGNDALGNVKSDNWATTVPTRKPRMMKKTDGHENRRYDGFNDRWEESEANGEVIAGANKRSVWTIAPQPFRGAHFATFPEKLAEPCILAGSRQGDLILDPFCGSGTTGVVSLKNGRRFLGIDQSLTYLNDIAAVRLKKETGIDPVISA
jgi:DNA modification methylase